MNNKYFNSSKHLATIIELTIKVRNVTSTQCPFKIDPMWAKGSRQGNVNKDFNLILDYQGVPSDIMQTCIMMQTHVFSKDSRINSSIIIDLYVV